LKRGQVLVCYAHGGTVAGEFARTLADNLIRNSGRIAGQSVQIGGPMIADHRNALVEKFLVQDAEWMWMVDTDMVLPSGTLKGLLTSAHWKDRPVVGALCFGSNRYANKFFPTIYAWTEEGLARGDNIDFRNQGLIEVDGTGAACILIHRSVLEKVAEEFPPPKGPFEFGWFDGPSGQQERIGEDLMFSVRVRNAGFPIYVDCDVQVGHWKPIILDVNYWERWNVMQSLRRTDGD